MDFNTWKTLDPVEDIAHHSVSTSASAAIGTTMAAGSERLTTRTSAIWSRWP